MLQECWNVRGNTRNKDSAGGVRALVDAGAEHASANYDVVASLEAASEGANAIFGVTNFLYVFLGHRSIMCLIWMRMFVARTVISQSTHSDKQGKDQAADDIKALSPELAKKTTFF